MATDFSTMSTGNKRSASIFQEAKKRRFSSPKPNSTSDGDESKSIGVQAYRSSHESFSTYQNTMAFKRDMREILI